MLEYIETVLVFVCIFGLGAMAFDLLLGYAGLVSLAQASFVGMGAYSSALLTTKLGWGFFPSLLVGIGIAAVLGFLIGVAVLHLAGDYLMVATVGFVFAVQAFLVGWDSLTRGADGVPGVPHIEIAGFAFNTAGRFLVLSVIVCLIFYFLSSRLVKSPYGRIVQAMHSDEIATSAMGKNLVAIKLSIFVIAAGIAAVSGSLYAHFVTFVEPFHYSLHETFTLFIMVVLGGMRTLKGAYLGAVILLGIPEIVRFMGLPTGVMGHVQEIIYGSILVIIAMFRPQGLLGRKKAEIQEEPQG
jgi:branched-chain amino acid transport system permease protein